MEDNTRVIMLDLSSLYNFKCGTGLEFALSFPVARANLTGVIFKRKMISLFYSLPCAVISLCLCQNQDEVTPRKRMSSLHLIV